MAWCDFKGIWKITSTTGTQRDSQSHRIAIGGSETNVFIYCIDNSGSHIYKSGGTYSSSADSITGPSGDAFTITRSGNALTFTEPSGNVAGSWTADDNLPPLIG